MQALLKLRVQILTSKQGKLWNTYQDSCALGQERLRDRRDGWDRTSVDTDKHASTGCMTGADSLVRKLLL